MSIGKGGWSLVLISTLTMSAVVLAQRPLERSSSLNSSAEIAFVRIEPGEFLMGCSERDTACNEDEKPAHRVKITKPFEIGKYEVTQAQWTMFMGSNPSVMRGNSRPVETVTKQEATEFLNKLNALNDGYRYRLPTEAEWEYAARAGSTGPFDGRLEEIAWYAGNSEDETHPVGTKQPNAWGLYDMAGNVREWVQDTYSATYYGTSPTDDPAGPAVGARGGRGPRGERRGGPGEGPRGSRGAQQLPPPPDGQPRGGPRGRGGRGAGGPSALPVMRGGAWDTLAPFVRVSSRYHYYGDTLRVSDVGFRAVRERIVP